MARLGPRTRPKSMARARPRTRARASGGLARPTLFVCLFVCLGDGSGGDLCGRASVYDIPVLCTRELAPETTTPQVAPVAQKSKVLPGT